MPTKDTCTWTLSGVDVLAMDAMEKSEKSETSGKGERVEKEGAEKLAGERSHHDGRARQIWMGRRGSSRMSAMFRSSLRRGGVLRPSVLVLVAALAIVLAPRPAWAYLDPGAGSLIYQTILAAVLGAGFVLRSSRARLVQLVKKLFARDRS